MLIVKFNDRLLMFAKLCWITSCITVLQRPQRLSLAVQSWDVVPIPLQMVTHGNVFLRILAFMGGKKHCF